MLWQKFVLPISDSSSCRTNDISIHFNRTWAKVNRLSYQVYWYCKHDTCLISGYCFSLTFNLKGPLCLTGPFRWRIIYSTYRLCAKKTWVGIHTLLYVAWCTRRHIQHILTQMNTLFAALIVFVDRNGHRGTGSIISDYRWECLAARHLTAAREIVILPPELNMTLNTQWDTRKYTGLSIHTSAC